MDCPTCGGEMQQLFTSWVCDNCENNKDRQQVGMKQLPAGFTPNVLYIAQDTCLIEGYIECNYTKYGGGFGILVRDRTQCPIPPQYLFKWYFTNKDIRDAVDSEWLLFKNGDEVWIPLVGTKGQNRGPLIITAVTAPPSSQILGANFKENVPAPQGGVNNLRVGIQTVKAIHQFWADILSGKKLPIP